jgi:hypothetical protein
MQRFAEWAALNERHDVRAPRLKRGSLLGGIIVALVHANDAAPRS